MDEQIEAGRVVYVLIHEVCGECGGERRVLAFTTERQARIREAEMQSRAPLCATSRVYALRVEGPR